jgi:hypothetical protein
LAKKASKSDAVMTGILVTRFKMGLIDVEDLEAMALTRSSSLKALKSSEGLRPWPG